MEELNVTGDAVTPASADRSHARRARIQQVRRGHAVLGRVLHRTLLSVLAHDCLNAAQSTAYSAIVALFPALIVAAAVVGLLPDTAPVRFQLAAFFDRVLPPGVSPLLDAAFEYSPMHIHSVRALVTAAIVSLAGASNVIVTLMDGLLRARDLPRDSWTFWKRRRRSFELVPLSLVPLAVVSVLVIFGHALTGWLAASVGPGGRWWVLAITVFLRWTVALGGSVGIIAMIYQMGVPDGHLGVPDFQLGALIAQTGTRSRSAPVAKKPAGEPPIAARTWWSILPGAVVATAMWLLTTLAFGWYVTRFANYSEVYGSLGAGIALLFWLYIISLSVLCGAEFNAQFDKQLQADSGIQSPDSPS